MLWTLQGPGARHLSGKKRAHELKKICGTPAGCPWDTRRDNRDLPAGVPEISRFSLCPRTPGRPGGSEGIFAESSRKFEKCVLLRQERVQKFCRKLRNFVEISRKFSANFPGLLGRPSLTKFVKNCAFQGDCSQRAPPLQPRLHSSHFLAGEKEFFWSFPSSIFYAMSCPET